MGPARAIFFDKDGPLMEAGGAERRIRLAPAAVTALHTLARRGFRFVEHQAA